MKKNRKYFLVLIVLLFLSMSVVNASTNTTTNTTVHTLEKTTTQTLETVATSTEEVQNEKNNINTTTRKEKQINKKNTAQNIKTATSKNISDYNTLKDTLTNTTSDDVTINIKANITLEGNTTLNNAIKNLTINGFHYTINGNATYQFLNIPSGTSVNLNNITITNCKANNGGAILVNGNLSCNNCNFINNTAQYDGGAIYYNSTANNNTYTNNTFTNNKANNNGGASATSNSLFLFIKLV